MLLRRPPAPPGARAAAHSCPPSHKVPSRAASPVQASSQAIRRRSRLSTIPRAATTDLAGGQRLPPSSTSTTSGGASGSRPPAVVHIRVADMEDYWPAADLHCRVFHTDVSESEQETWKGLSLRVDRVLALQINDKIAGQGAGRSALLLAFDGDAPATPEQLEAAGAAFRAAAAAAQLRGSPYYPAFPRPMFWLGRSLAPGVRPGVGVSAESVGLLGVAAVDSFGDLVPPRELNWRTDGQMGWYRREGYAYVSNVAVSPAARRRGIARQLMAAAEAQAAEWGCRAVGLHCNPKKKAPWSLYESLGYRDTGVVEPALMPYLHGRPPDRCSFLLKLVPSWWENAGRQRAEGVGAEGAEAKAGEAQP